MTDSKEQSIDKEIRTRRYHALGAKEVLYSSGAAIVSFCAAAAAAIRREFNEEFKSRPGMRDFEVYAEELEKYSQKGWIALNNGAADLNGNVTFQGLSSAHEKELFDLDLRRLAGEISEAAHLDGKRAIKDKFADRRLSLLENEYHIPSRGIWNGFVKGTYDRFKEIGKSTDRWAVAFAGVSAAAVVGITVYNLLTSIATRKKAREIEDILLDKALLKTDRPEMLVIEHKEGEPTARVSHVSRENTVAADQAPALAATSR